MSRSPSVGFRPRLVPTLLAVPMLAILVTLGVWQLERLEWKTALIDRIEARLDAPAATLPAGIADPAAWEYRRVAVEGRFLHDRELYLAGRAHERRLGYHVVTPLVRADVPGDPVILVDRGWVPEPARDPATRPESLPAGTVRVEGIARLPAEPGWFTPDNRPAANEWYWRDLPAMAAAVGMAPAAPLFLEAADRDPDSLPIGGRTRIDLPNNHLQYALTWFALALALLAIYIAYHRPRAPSGDSSTS